jgi:hypothetical protein
MQLLQPLVPLVAIAAPSMRGAAQGLLPWASSAAAAMAGDARAGRRTLLLRLSQRGLVSVTPL